MILVTGAAGVSGSMVIREFVRRDTPVRALVRNRDRDQRLQTLPGVELVEGDMSRPDTLGAALDGVHRVLMISSPDEQMAETQCSFIDTAKDAGIPYVVKYSGVETAIGFKPEDFRFARMHEEIEDYLEESGLAWTHLRPSEFMQVLLRAAPTIVANDALFFPWGNAEVARVDLEDVAKIAFAVLHNDGHEGKSYDITGPEALMGSAVAETISRVVGRTVRYVDVSPDQWRQAMLAAGLPAERIDGLNELFGARRKHPEARIDLSAHEAFGIYPTTFAEFALREGAVFRGETGDDRGQGGCIPVRTAWRSRPKEPGS